jgi:hypothetical protein
MADARVVRMERRKWPTLRKMSGPPPGASNSVLAFFKEHGFGDTAALYDEAQVLCTVKALVLEDIERRAEDFRKSLEQSGKSRA